MKKRLLTLALAILMVVTFQMPVNAASFHSDMRIRLTIGSNTEFTIETVGDFSIAEYPDISLSDGQEITLYANGNSIEASIGDETLRGTKLTFLSGGYGELSDYIRLDNSRYGVCTYLGNMQFDVVGGSIRAINTLPTEQYLYGVVPYEMSNSFPIEALKAQAVCARGYAMARASTYASRSYDLVDTSSDQVYRGYASRNARAISAVDDTKGQVLAYDGDIIEAFYGASNGGQTERTGNVWSTDYDYYINQDDYFDLANASSISYEGFIPEIYDENTIALMDAEMYNAFTLLASEASGEQVTLRTTDAVIPHGAIYDEPSRSYTMADIYLGVELGDGSIGQVMFTIELEDFVYDDAINTLGNLDDDGYSLRMQGAERTTRTADNVTYDGYQLTTRRYGHGIGMSQRGAQERARAGQTYEQILAFYYVNTYTLVSGEYSEAPALTSEDYNITENYIDKIALGTTPGELTGSIIGEGITLSTITAKGDVKVEDPLLTGNYLRVNYDDNKVLDIPLVIYGDMDGVYGIDEGDVRVLSDHLMRISLLNGVYEMAADVNRDGIVNSEDLRLLILSINDDYSISQSN